MEHRLLPAGVCQFHPESILTPYGPAMLANFLRLAKSLSQTTISPIVWTNRGPNGKIRTTLFFP